MLKDLVNLWIGILEPSGKKLFSMSVSIHRSNPRIQHTLCWLSSALLLASLFAIDAVAVTGAAFLLRAILATPPFLAASLRDIVASIMYPEYRNSVLYLSHGV